jgi:hypothetical protein
VDNGINVAFGSGNVYDHFVAPAGGWTVAGVFSRTTKWISSGVTQAEWQIRSAFPRETVEL